MLDNEKPADCKRYYRDVANLTGEMQLVLTSEAKGMYGYRNLPDIELLPSHRYALGASG